MKTQKEKLREHLINYGSITRKQGINDLNIMNLPEIIRQLRKSGMNIDSDWVDSKNAKYVCYKLITEPQQTLQL